MKPQNGRLPVPRERSPDPVCIHCSEPVTRHAEWIPFADATGSRMLVARHPECAARSVIGGLNHLIGRCTCCGGTEDPDPPGMTRREAAIAAVEYWRTHG